jgi:hypothetical protein
MTLGKNFWLAQHSYNKRPYRRSNRMSGELSLALKALLLVIAVLVVLCGVLLASFVL